MFRGGGERDKETRRQGDKGTVRQSGLSDRLIVFAPPQSELARTLRQRLEMTGVALLPACS